MKVYRDREIGEVFLNKSPRARRVSIRVRPDKGVIVTLPRWAPYSVGIVFLTAKRKWVQDCLQRQAAQKPTPGDGLSPQERTALVEEMRAEAKRTLIPRLQELAARYGFSPARVTIKHNISNWGSCSRLGNINLNLNLVRVPAQCRDYVILHELCHLRHLNHGPEFHALLDSLLFDCLGSYPYGSDGSDATAWTSSLCRRELKSYRMI